TDRDPERKPANTTGAGSRRVSAGCVAHLLPTPPAARVARRHSEDRERPPRKAAAPTVVLRRRGRGEDVRRVRGIGAVRLGEQRVEGVAVVSQALVLAEEVPAAGGCDRGSVKVERRRRDSLLVTPRRAA